MCSAGQLSQLLERAEQLLTASERQDEQLASLARRKTALTQANTELSQRLAELENAPKARLPPHQLGSEFCIFFSFDMNPSQTYFIGTIYILFSTLAICYRNVTSSLSKS